MVKTSLRHQKKTTGFAFRSPVHVACLAAVLTWPLAVVCAPSTLAQSRPTTSRTYLNPFPQTDRYHIYVIGDSLAEGLAQGLDDAFQKESSVKIFNVARSSSGMARNDGFDWTAEVGRITPSQPMHVAVILMGLNDQRTIKIDGTSQKWGAPGWTEAYGKSVERLIKKLKSTDVAIYWVGLPIMAKAGANEAVDTMNNIVREKCYLNGAKYIESSNGFTDQFGAYTIYGSDLTGQQKRLRDTDGEHFTTAGYRKLASYVDVVIRRDLAAARTERNIPLVGDEEEQARIFPHAAAPQAADAKSPKAKNDATTVKTEASAPPQQSGLTEAAKLPSSNGAPLASSQGGASHSGAPLADAPAAGASAGSAPQGELIAGDIKGGMTALATVSSFYDVSLKASQRRTPPAESTYYKVLVRGETLKPKAGRTDDFKWPRT
jgi:uncharacterized protein